MLPERETYAVKVAGLERDLRLFEVAPGLRIAVLNILGDTELVGACARHLAELLAGVPYRLPHHVTVRQDGRPVRLDYLENDHCCELFRGVNDWLDNDGAQSYGTVGHAASKIVCAKDLIDIVVPRLRDDPFALIHPRDSDCSECAAAWRSVEC